VKAARTAWWREFAGQAFGLGVLALMLFALIAYYTLQGSADRIAWGTIVKVGGYTGKGQYRPLLVRFPDGTIQHRIVPVVRANNCKAGDRIRLVEVAGTYVVSTAGCER
jgi:hypothetical protein